VTEKQSIRLGYFCFEKIEKHNSCFIDH
jgi:hypothetical protein